MPRRPLGIPGGRGAGRGITGSGRGRGTTCAGSTRGASASTPLPLLPSTLSPLLSPLICMCHPHRNFPAALISDVICPQASYHYSSPPALVSPCLPLFAPVTLGAPHRPYSPLPHVVHCSFFPLCLFLSGSSIAVRGSRMPRLSRPIAERCWSYDRVSMGCLSIVR